MWRGGGGLQQLPPPTTDNLQPSPGPAPRVSQDPSVHPSFCWWPSFEHGWTQRHSIDCQGPGELWHRVATTFPALIMKTAFSPSGSQDFSPGRCLTGCPVGHIQVPFRSAFPFLSAKKTKTKTREPIFLKIHSFRVVRGGFTFAARGQLDAA